MTKSIKCYFPVLAVTFLALAASAFAQETFRNPALEEDSEFDRVFARARALARSGNPEEAIKEFQNAASLKKGDCADCFQMIGQVYFQMGKYIQSVASFRHAIALKPANEAELTNGLGVALYQIGDKKSLEEAATAFRRAVELSEGKLAKAQYNLGRTLLSLGKKEEGIAALQQFVEANPSSPDAYQARRLIEKPSLSSVNLAPDFKVTSLTGDELSLAKYRGKIILLDFWATWCGPCIYEMPEVKKIWKKYGGDNFVIIGISLDTNLRALESYVEKEGIGWPQYFEGRGSGQSVSRIYGVRSIPHTVLIDQDGAVQEVGLRGGRLSGRISELIKQLQKQQSAPSNGGNR